MHFQGTAPRSDNAFEVAPFFKSNSDFSAGTATKISSWKVGVCLFRGEGPWPREPSLAAAPRHSRYAQGRRVRSWERGDGARAPFSNGLLPQRPCSLFLKTQTLALAGVAQWTERRPVNQGVAALIPGQGTSLGSGPARQ